MIVRMNKVTVLGLAHDRAATLEELRNLGVLHVKPVVAPAGAGLEQAREKANGLQTLLDALPVLDEPQPTGRDAWPMIAEISELLNTRKEWQDRLDTLTSEIVRVEPLGDFDPRAIADLARKGVVVKLYRAPAKASLPLPEGVSFQRLAQVKSDVLWALFAREPFEWEGAEEFRLPEDTLSELRNEAEALGRGLTGIARQFEQLANDRAKLEQLLVQAEAEVKLQEVRAGMGAAEAIAYVQGFMPATDVERVRDAAARHGWGLLVEDPGPEDDVPVKLRQPAWVKPIQAVFDGINILPGYAEADVSAVFILFFSLFFAMIVGDAGYGSVFLVLTLLFRKKMPRNASNLLIITSVCTILWGLVTGSVFGISHELLQNTFFAKFWIPYLHPLRERTVQNIMGLCFLIGAVQLSIGHLWNVVDLVRAKSLKALEQLGWTLTTWFLFFLADSMVISGNMVSYIGSPRALVPLSGSLIDYTAILGVLLIIFFMMKPSEIKDNWFNLALLPLDLIGNFTDVVSYVRLYAVGTAGFAVADAFNTMIFGGEVTLLGGILGAVLVFAAHTLNILLCIMGVLVHGIRLNTLEFANHKGISWSGSPYRPFARPEPAA
jgi:V/A-type H+-transporting ATPase subunit I